MTSQDADKPDQYVKENVEVERSEYVKRVHTEFIGCRKVCTALAVRVCGTRPGIGGICGENDRHATATNGKAPYVGHVGAAGGNGREGCPGGQ